MSENRLDKWTNTNVGYTYAIGGKPFFVDPSKEHTYQRGTAQYRKDQVDTSDNVGAQSLDGAWTYSQLSFHRGAGTDYADASDPDLDYTFDWSSGVEPNPGDATVTHDWKLFDDTQWQDVKFFQPEQVLSNSSAFVLANGGTGGGSTLRRIGSAWAVQWSDAAEFVAMDPHQQHWVYYSSSSAVYNRWHGNARNHIYDLPADCVGLWCAKNRLVMMDNGGRFYSGAEQQASTETLTGADAFWTLPDGYPYEDWHVVDSPGDVYFSSKNTVWGLTIDSGNPTWGAPRVVAQLPDGEFISDIVYYLGRLVIMTNKGVRVAQVASGGSIAFGPVIVDCHAPWVQGTRFGKKGNRIYFVGYAGVESQARFYTLDLSRPNKDGTYAYWRDFRPWSLVQEDAIGVTVWNDDVWVYGPSSGCMRASSNTIIGQPRSGMLQTSDIRMGTLVDKVWTSIRVLASGYGVLTVNVSTGPDALVFQWPLSGTGGPPKPAGSFKDFDLRGMNPSTGVRVTFTLEGLGDSPSTPHLHGFQLKAYPTPERHRLIRVPLLIRDFDKSPAGVVDGHDGWAWERLNELEQLEESAALVSFQDFRTGEDGTAYIESVQFENTTGPRQDTDGFGGVAMVTLRKIG